MNFEINKFAFLYGDLEYFEWFKANPKTKENFRNILKWKGIHRRIDINKAWDNWQNKTIDKYRLVTRVFLNHLRDPIEYPILDRFVFKAMRDLSAISKYRTNKNPFDWERDYKGGYKKFFNELYAENEKQIDSMDLPIIDGVDKEIIKRRVLDRALLEFGRINYEG